MPEIVGSPKGRGPEAGQRRRKLLQTGLGLAGTALALDVLAAAKPATSALVAASTFRTRGRRTGTDAPIEANEIMQTATHTGPFHPIEADVQPAAPLDGTLAQQGISVPKIGDFSPDDGLHWLEQHWREVVTVGAPIGAGAVIVAIVRGRATSANAMESSFQQALTLLGSGDVESKAAAAEELLYLLSDPRSEKYHR